MLKTKMPIDTVSKLLGIKRTVLIKYGKRLSTDLNQGVDVDMLGVLIKHYGSSVKRKTKEAKLAYNTAYGLSGYGIDNYFSSHVN